MQETRVWSLGGENPLDKEMATNSSTLAWEIPWTEEARGLQSMGLQRNRYKWATDKNETLGQFLKTWKMKQRNTILGNLGSWLALHMVEIYIIMTFVHPGPIEISVPWVPLPPECFFTEKLYPGDRGYLAKFWGLEAFLITLFLIKAQLLQLTK